MKRFLKLMTSLASVLAMFSAFAMHSVARADENVGEKIENKVDEVKTDANKSHRKAKRNYRKKTGQDSIAKDARDAASDTGDAISHETKKAKNKVD